MLKKLGSIFLILVMLSMSMVACTPSTAASADGTGESVTAHLGRFLTRVSRKSKRKISLKKLIMLKV